ncbi:ribose-phosphate pyrophosphokinase [Marivirga atlantica]|jgi:ribose-phosphate pyrophosphokinase|uniref:ribose-phosphate diphosphokinase n=1 Tax=Marivirga atlantica TaxID=1548457 RepID=A0A937ALF3_9BACT|nr:ribose-phosphate pyrophosphokinase [Marivirga atlantica]MBL0765718.1 ribose-phosphate pyrophosphokinase [Marivirga atlantica]
MSSVKIFSGSASKYLADKIASSYGTPLGDVELQKFSDGELSPYYTESIRGHHVFLIQSTFPPADNLMELLLMIDAAKRASAENVTVVVPYFGYARQDRKDKPRVAIGAKMIANILEAAGVDRIVTCDLHAGQIQGFFNIPLDHLDASAIFVPYLKESITKETIFASPDVGGTARARRYAKHFKVDMVVCDKHRQKANEVAAMQVIGDVKGKDVILFDDLVDTAGTLCKAADVLKEKGAKSVRAVITHPVLSGKAYENIAGSTLDELITTDTLPLREKSDKIKVLTVADMFAKAIRKIHDHESISSLFI